jgi:hypothetical protein
MEPAKARINPAIDVLLWLFFDGIIKQRSPKEGAGIFYI